MKHFAEFRNKENKALKNLWELKKTSSYNPFLDTKGLGEAASRLPKSQKNLNKGKVIPEKGWSDDVLSRRGLAEKLQEVRTWRGGGTESYSDRKETFNDSYMKKIIAESKERRANRPKVADTIPSAVEIKKPVVSGKGALIAGGIGLGALALGGLALSSKKKEPEQQINYTRKSHFANFGIPISAQNLIISQVKPKVAEVLEGEEQKRFKRGARLS